jgi:thiol-disulfide isomerase/thioredoxin
MRQLFCAAALLLVTTFAHALQIVPYTPEKHAALQQAGQPHALHFHADWCGTCIEQERALEKLKGDKSLASVTLMVVDYDKNKPLRKQLKVAMQSTFVVFKGQNEVARNGGETQANVIKSLLAKAL